MPPLSAARMAALNLRGEAVGLVGQDVFEVLVLFFTTSAAINKLRSVHNPRPALSNLSLSAHVFVSAVWLPAAFYARMPPARL